MERSRGPTQRRGAIAGPNPGSLQALCGRPPMQRRSAIAGRDVGSPQALCGRPCLKRLVELLVLNGTATVKIQNAKRCRVCAIIPVQYPGTVLYEE